MKGSCLYKDIIGSGLPKNGDPIEAEPFLILSCSYTVTIRYTEECTRTFYSPRRSSRCALGATQCRRPWSHRHTNLQFLLRTNLLLQYASHTLSSACGRSTSRTGNRNQLSGEMLERPDAQSGAIPNLMVVQRLTGIRSLTSCAARQNVASRPPIK